MLSESDISTIFSSYAIRHNYCNQWRRHRYLLSLNNKFLQVKYWIFCCCLLEYLNSICNRYCRQVLCLSQLGLALKKVSSNYKQLINVNTRNVNYEISQNFEKQPSIFQTIVQLFLQSVQRTSDASSILFLCQFRFPSFWPCPLQSPRMVSSYDSPAARKFQTTKLMVIFFLTTSP